VTRSELVRLFVLDWICDNYENVDQLILRRVAEMGAECTLTIDRLEVVEALAGLVEDGFAKAYLFSSEESMEIEGMPSIDIVEEDFITYFRVTEKGMELHLSDKPDWPFDHNGNLRPDWHLGGGL